MVGISLPAFIDEDTEVQGGSATCPECPSWDEIWVSYCQGSFCHTTLPFFTCLSCTNASVFSRSRSRCFAALRFIPADSQARQAGENPLLPTPAPVPRPGVGAGLPLQWKPVVTTVALGALPRLALPPGGSGVELAGEGAHQECQGGDASFSYHDMECLCCHGVLGVTLH